MEKKTIGSFIATLRKASGLTQKQLAEMLLVTDKTVSRWERDETLPDLTLIPVIAEIFGITSDELLRGERKTPSVAVPPVDQRAQKPREENDLQGEKYKSESRPSASAVQRGEKQIQRMLKITRTKFQMHRIISLALAVIGLVTALGCENSFSSRSGIDGQMLGGMLGIIINLAAIVHLILHTVTAYQSIDIEEFDGQQIQELKTFVVKKTLSTCRGILIAFVLVFVGILTGWDGEEWFFLSLIWAGVMAGVCYIASGLVTYRLKNDHEN